jgi:hypothetical protein
MILVASLKPYYLFYMLRNSLNPPLDSPLFKILLGLLLYLLGRLWSHKYAILCSSLFKIGPYRLNYIYIRRVTIPKKPLYLTELKKNIVIGINIRGGFIFLDKYIRTVFFINLNKGISFSFNIYIA